MHETDDCDQSPFEKYQYYALQLLQDTLLHERCIVMHHPSRQWHVDDPLRYDASHHGSMKNYDHVHTGDVSVSSVYSDLESFFSSSGNTYGSYDVEYDALFVSIHEKEDELRTVFPTNLINDLLFRWSKWFSSWSSPRVQTGRFSCFAYIPLLIAESSGCLLHNVELIVLWSNLYLPLHVCRCSLFSCL